MKRNRLILLLSLLLIIAVWVIVSQHGTIARMQARDEIHERFWNQAWHHIDTLEERNAELEEAMMIRLSGQMDIAKSKYTGEE